MSIKKIISISAITVCSLTISNSVYAALDPNAEVVHVRQNCGQLTDCSSSMTEIADWIHFTRHPSVNNPVIVDIGPGQFSGFYCSGDGNITLRGSGANNTQLVGNTAISVDSCTNLSFEHLTVKGSYKGINWTGPGNSSYTDVVLAVDGNAVTYAWFDNCDASNQISVHYFFGSKIIAEGNFYNFGYYSNCAETWFYGSEITAKAKQPSGYHVLANVPVRVAGQNSIVQVYGSAVRAIRGSSDKFYKIAGNQGLVAAQAQNGASFHMHGGILTATAAGANQDNDAAGILALGGSFVHVIDTAFNVRGSGNGTAYRIFKDATSTVSSPFQWAASADVPVGNDFGSSIKSETGADMFVETDCDTTGNCQNSGTDTHIMIYNDNCTTDGPWFDTTTGRCRGVIAP